MLWLIVKEKVKVAAISWTGLSVQNLLFSVPAFSNLHHYAQVPTLFAARYVLQLRKAVLVEGSPGVGKTALVGALASRAQVPLVSVLCVCLQAGRCFSLAVLHDE